MTELIDSAIYLPQLYVGITTLTNNSFPPYIFSQIVLIYPFCISVMVSIPTLFFSSLSPAVVCPSAIPSVESLMNKTLIVANMIFRSFHKLGCEIYIRSNKNLFDQVMALYKHTFIENNVERKSCRADEYFDITIGKTPPRKEHEWFSTNQQDERWVSISDMGNCELYISNTSERLTHDAVRRFNIVIVPDNTVLLSFKLTVGRLAITDGEMVTNEAIAHFKTNMKEINPYLYCYFKNFNYQSLGSTSSIATAVNSKIIKGMPFVIPEVTELQHFNEIAIPAFAAIRSNQTESKSLSELRDSLLPKLMSGEIDVSDIDL